MILECPKCKSRLVGGVVDGWTTCPNCDRRWQLNDDWTSVRSITLEVHPNGHGHKTRVSTIAGDLDEIGDWDIQAKVVLTTGTWKSDIGHFTVFENL